MYQVAFLRVDMLLVSSVKLELKLIAELALVLIGQLLTRTRMLQAHHQLAC